MASHKAPTSDSPPRRALVQPALPVVLIKQSTGRGTFESSSAQPSALINATAVSNLSLEDLNEPTKTPSNDTNKSEDSGEPENVRYATHMETVATTESLIAESSRRVSLLPRSASTGNIGSLRAAAGSGTYDLPKSSHIELQSIAIDDPFLSPEPDHRRAGFCNASTTPPRIDRVHAVQALKTPEQDISPRQDRLGQEVTPANAQGIHTPAACVFVANLSSQRTLDQLEYSVSKAMEIYGKCYVKVQFDKNKMPYAFVQFENEEEARICLTNAKGLVIDGRPIRVEHARAQRAVYLSKITGGPVTDEEARNMLGRFGAIEETCPTTVADQQMHGLPEGIWIKFAYFMDCKDAIAEFRHNQFYKLHVQEKNERGQQGSTASPSSNRGSNRGFRQGSDAKAIFVGGLPVTVTEDQLRDIFNPYGNILDCKVIRKSLVGDQVNVFAFIEFRTVTEAQSAQSAQLSVAGVPLRIEPKRYTMRRAARNNLNHSPITFTSPNHQSPIYHGSGARNQYDTSFPSAYNSYTNTQSPHVMPIRSGPPPLMSPYTQYPSPHYTSPLAPRGAGYDMSSPSPMYHSGAVAPAPPTYYGSYMVGGPPSFSTGMSMGHGGMQPIAEHEGQVGSSGF